MPRSSLAQNSKDVPFVDQFGSLLNDVETTRRRGTDGAWAWMYRITSPISFTPVAKKSSGFQRPWRTAGSLTIDQGGSS